MFLLDFRFVNCQECILVK